MSGADWRDPFAEDEGAAERERRRAEREERRRQRQARIGARVQQEANAPAPPPERVPPQEPPSPPPPSGPSGPGSAPYRRRRVLVALVILVVIAAGVVGAIAVIHRLGDNAGSAAPAAHAAKGKVPELTIPEGLDRSQIADLAKKSGIRGDYEKASVSFKGFDPAKYGADHPKSLEGFLFPATYELPRRPTVDDLVSRQLEAFKQNIAGVDMGYAKSKNLTTYDVLIIASMIEREVQVPSERKLVAAVIYNRLHQGIQLQIDATIRYAEGNYTKPLGPSDLALDSPYNTYTNFGLPPGPISNPGVASIEAAAHPAHVNYLYYVVKPCGNGAHFFTASYAAFQAAQARYNNARNANGGRSPENC